MKVLCIFGTRPEAIKMAPLVRAFKQDPAGFDVEVCTTGQHKEMLMQVLDFFSITPDYPLEIMRPNQTLFDITTMCLNLLQPVLATSKPDVVMVQGDTTTAFVGALAAYYLQIKVAHLEAGLRSHNKYSPFPEEMNRKLVGPLADYHFAPTKRAVADLAAEGIIKNVWNVGNSVIDALYWGRELVNAGDEIKYRTLFPFLQDGERFVLVTGHRRESFGKPFENICNAIKEIAANYKDIQIVYPVHLNPNVRSVVFDTLKGLKNIHLIEPVNYPTMIWLLDHCYIVLTDSGGIQEEAPSLGKPVLVMREVTERMEGVEAGTAKLVGTDYEKIIGETTRLLDDKTEYDNMATAKNPYGDGNTSSKVLSLLKRVEN